ncbi:MAG: outer membrane beta-barrel protein [Spirochaetota bacterium]|jgi:opacity protein-like surface antigen|nr:outer membrane beta-barrel protein [Spirochaetota bacterium]
MKRLSLLAILALALFPAGLSAGLFSGLFSGPDGVDWREESLARQLSVGAGVWRAYWADVTYDGGNKEQYIFDPTYMVSVGAKYFFYGSNFGLGLDGVLMESHKEPYPAFNDPAGNAHPAGNAIVTQWLLDINAYYRYPIFYFLNLMGGAGLTCSFVDYGEMPKVKSSTSAAGWNIKLGAEFFVSDIVSLSLFGTYHSFNKGAVIGGVTNKNADVKLTSFFLMINYYM